MSNGFLWCRTRLISEISQVLRSTKAWSAVSIHWNRKGLELAAGDVRFGRLRWDGRVDVWVPPDVRDRLVAEHMAACHPDEPCSHRVVWIMRTPQDVDRAVWLLRLGYLSLVRE